MWAVVHAFACLMPVFCLSRGAPSGKSQPRGGSQRGAEAEGDFEFAWQVEPYRLEVCHHPDGRPWRLGQGGYGTVRVSRGGGCLGRGRGSHVAGGPEGRGSSLLLLPPPLQTLWRIMHVHVPSDKQGGLREGAWEAVGRAGEAQGGQRSGWEWHVCGAVLLICMCACPIQITAHKAYNGKELASPCKGDVMHTLSMPCPLDGLASSAHLPLFFPACDCERKCKRQHPASSNLIQSQVYKARLDGVTDVAIKFLKPEAHGLNSGDGAGRFFAEVNVLRAARNKYILMFMGAWLHEVIPQSSKIPPSNSVLGGTGLRMH